MLDKFIRVHNEHPEFDTAALNNQMFVGIYAGLETCGNILPTIAYRIAKTPRCQAQLHKELDEARKSGDLSDPPLYDETQQLPYLMACMSEGIRMHPILGTTLARKVPEGGVEISGKYIPAGVSETLK